MDIKERANGLKKEVNGLEYQTTVVFDEINRLKDVESFLVGFYDTHFTKEELKKRLNLIRKTTLRIEELLKHGGFKDGE